MFIRRQSSVLTKPRYMLALASLALIVPIGCNSAQTERSQQLSIRDLESRGVLKKGTEAAALVVVPDEFRVDSSLNLADGGDGSTPGENPAQPPQQDPDDTPDSGPENPGRIMFGCAATGPGSASVAGVMTARLFEVIDNNKQVIEEAQTDLDCRSIVIQIAGLFPSKSYEVAVEMVNREGTVAYYGLTNSFSVQPRLVTPLDLVMKRRDRDPTGVAEIRVLFEGNPPPPSDDICSVEGGRAFDFGRVFFQLPLVREMADRESDPEFLVLNHPFGVFKEYYHVNTTIGRHPPLTGMVYRALLTINARFCNGKLKVGPFLKMPGEYFGAQAVACARDYSACKFLISSGAPEASK